MRPQSTTIEGINPWQYGEDLDNQRRYVLKALTLARTEFTHQGKVSDYLKASLKKIGEEFPPSDAVN